MMFKPQTYFLFYLPAFGGGAAGGGVVLIFSSVVGFLGGSVVENLPANAGDVGLIPGSGRSPRARNGNPCQYSCLGNSMHRGAWRAAVHGVTKDMT